MKQLLKLIREVSAPAAGGAEGYTLGRLYRNGLFFCFTCEDEDRHLEGGKNVKIKALTAIPRGMYLVTVSMSKRFGKKLPEIHGVPGFEGIRIHGGNKAENSEGCILVGSVRTKNGVANCAPCVDQIIKMIETAGKGVETWLEIV